MTAGDGKMSGGEWMQAYIHRLSLSAAKRCADPFTRRQTEPNEEKIDIKRSCNTVKCINMQLLACTISYHCSFRLAQSLLSARFNFEW